MKRFKKILLAFDGSKDSVKALDVARDLTKRYDAHLTVVYVSEASKERSLGVSYNIAGDPYLYQDQEESHPGVIDVDFQPMPHDELENFIFEDEIPIYIKNLAKTKLSKTDFAVSYEILYGKPVDELSKFTEENDVDLIVIGHRGLRGFQKFVQGSVSQKITQEVECSVLVVK